MTWNSMAVNGAFSANTISGNGANLTNAAGWARSGGNISFLGKVGIGTTNPTTALTVNGKILAEEFEIITDVPASDYVFESNYKLRTLQEIETFVAQHKHLPEVPSAQEFKENGYKVGQMDDLLLRKVEELTLYAIELNKQVEALKAELAKVKKGE
jgi:hypothetical protein